MMNWKYCTMLIGVVITFTSCGHGSFLDEVGKLNSGYYENRNREKESILKNKQRENQILQQNTDKNDRKIQELNEKLTTEYTSIARMEKDIDLLKSNINRLNSQSNNINNEIIVIKGKIMAFRKRLADQKSTLIALEKTGSTEIDRKLYDQLELERNQLEKEYTALIEYYYALSESIN